MRVIGLQVENFKILKAIDIQPKGNVVTIQGKNGQGKSSVLDAIWVALAGRAVAPPKPIRAGEEKCLIRLDLGELVITRTFTDKGEGKITDTVKVESGDGSQRFNSPQSVIDNLMGAIGFDPLAFVQRRPEEQAEMLLELVPLPIDLEVMAREDAADYEKRTEVNRDVRTLDAQIAVILERDDLPAQAPDRNALQDALAGAASKNGDLERERMSREQRMVGAARTREAAQAKANEADRLRDQAKELDRQAADLCDEATTIEKEVKALPALGEPVDTAKLRDELRAAEDIAVAVAGQDRRKALVAERTEKAAQADAFTTALDAREAKRKAALASAKMPIEGLAFGLSEKGKPVVTLNGVPFEQASTAEQIKASVAIAMASNPELKVLRIKDGSLLDEDTLALVAGMAEAEDFQIIMEVVGTGGVGFVIEDGMVKGAPAAEPKAEKPAAKKAAAPAADDKAGPLL